MINASPNSAYLANRQNSNQSNQNNRMPNVNWNYQPGVNNRTTNNSQPMRIPTKTSPVGNIAIANTAPVYPQGLPQGVRVVRMQNPQALQRQQQALLQQRMQYQKTKDQRDNFHKTINTLCLVAMGIAAVVGTLTLAHLGKNANNENVAKQLKFLKPDDMENLDKLPLPGVFSDVLNKMKNMLNVSASDLKAYGIKTEGRTLLLFGPPGNGKTTFVQMLARKLGFTFHEIKSEELVSKYHNETPQKLHARMESLYEHAKTHKDEKFLIFFDEIDSLIAKSESNLKQEREQEINALKTGFNNLKKLDNIFIVAATNKNPGNSNLDSAMTSRFAEKYFIKPADSKQIEEILKLHFNEISDKCEDSIKSILDKFSEFFNENFASLRSIDQVKNDAGNLAINRKEKINTIDILKAIYKNRENIKTDAIETATDWAEELSLSDVQKAWIRDYTQAFVGGKATSNYKFNDEFAKLINDKLKLKDTEKLDLLNTLNLDKNDSLPQLLGYKFDGGKYVPNPPSP